MNLLQLIRKQWMEWLIAGIWLNSIVGAALAQEWIVMAYLAFGGLILLLAIFACLAVYQRLRHVPLAVGEGFLKPRQGLALTVGYQKETAMFTIRHQKPKWLCLLCTRGTQSVAEEIALLSGLPEEKVQKEIADAWNIQDVAEKAESLYKWLARQELGKEDIVFDITGGTTPMSVGVFSVADFHSVDTQYVRSQYDANNHAIPNTQECILVRRAAISD